MGVEGRHVQANIDRFSGFADTYDDVRPQPPHVMVDMLTQMAGAAEPALVVDLGSGTGLSTRIWAGRAREVIGIEPNADMRAEAAKHTPAHMPGIRYMEGTSTQTGLLGGCAEVATAVQALHWMEPEGTLAEVARILRPGVYDTVRRWPKSRHLENMKSSGRFRFVRELYAHQVDSGNAARYMALVHSQGGVVAVLRRGYTEEQVGLERLREIARRVIGEREMPWYYGYKIRVGVV